MNWDENNRLGIKGRECAWLLFVQLASPSPFPHSTGREHTATAHFFCVDFVFPRFVEGWEWAVLGREEINDAFLGSCGRWEGDATQQNNLVHKKRKPESGALHHHLLFILWHSVKGLGEVWGERRRAKRVLLMASWWHSFPRLEIICAWKSLGQMEKGRAWEGTDFGRMEKNRQTGGTQDSCSFPHFYRKDNRPDCRALELGFEALGCRVACGGLL